MAKKAAKKVGYAKYRTNHLKKITDKARKIRKPGEKWTSAVKRAAKVGSVAGKQYKAVPKKYKVEGELVPKKKGGKPVPRVTRVQLNGAAKKRYVKPVMTVVPGGVLSEIRRQMELIGQKERQILGYSGSTKGLQAQTKKFFMQQKKKLRNEISAAKKYITQLKKSI